MKCAFICNKPKEVLNKVYTETVRENIGKNNALFPEIVTEKDLTKYDFRNLEIIFSTWGMPRLREDEIKTAFPSLKAVFYAAGSVQAFAKPFLNLGINVFSAWAANAVPVAEFTAAQILLANKGFLGSTRLFKENGRQAAAEYAHRFGGNYGTKVGIIGAGMIGKLVIDRLKCSGLEILVFDPFLSDDSAQSLGVKKCGLHELFAECLTISNHLADNDQTKNMLDYDCFSRMPSNATFINTGRGAQVVESDLCRALSDHPLRTALLDVTWPEPPDEKHAFYRMDNVVLTPHIAGSSGNEPARMGDYMYQEFLDFCANKTTRYEVTLDMLKTMA